MAEDIPGVIEITDENFEEHTSEGRALVDFYASWCPHCKAFRAVYERFAQDYVGPLKLLAADVDLTKQATAAFKLRSVPTLVLLGDGEKVDQRTGHQSAEALAEWLAEASDNG